MIRRVLGSSILALWVLMLIAAEPIGQHGAAKVASNSPARVAMRFESDPDGAQVVDVRGTPVGVTPVVRAFVRDGRVHEFLFRHDGQTTKKVAVRFDRNRSVLVVFQPLDRQSVETVRNRPFEGSLGWPQARRMPTIRTRPR